MKAPITLLEFNELSFDLIQKYAKLGELKNFKKAIDKYGINETSSEEEYHLLEPWIQWVTAHSGLEFKEHKTFRLGDIKNNQQFFWETLHKSGIKSCLISPMNAKNNNLKGNIFFPDPWTETSVSGNWILKRVHSTVSKLVKNNAQNKITFNNIFTLLIGFAFFSRIKNYPKYIYFALTSFKFKWRRAMFLDIFLFDIFIFFTKRKIFDINLLFLNGAAHIQHHYYLSSYQHSIEDLNPEWYCPKNKDPVLEIFKLYDYFLEESFQRKKNQRLMVVTGLSQKPIDKPCFYWRLNDHEDFLRQYNISFKNVMPLMSRDFIINFENEASCKISEEKMSNITINNEKIFHTDNRGNSLFVSLVYDKEINHDSKLFKQVSLVALKNSIHNEKGYILDTSKKINVEKFKLKFLNDEIINHFNK
tara:strand:- start:2233 stop:3486 length:1254 start_codon:yes stop_codon:yes gene_type:complete